MDSTVELLDRQVAFLLKQSDDTSFLIQIDPFLRALEADDRLVSYLEDARDEVIAAAQVLANADDELVPELVALRDELVRLLPGVDDSLAIPPQVGPGGENFSERFAYDRSLASFDAIVGGDGKLFNREGVGGKSGQLIEILQGKDQHYVHEQEESEERLAGETETDATETLGEADAVDSGGESDADSAGEVVADGCDVAELRRWRIALGNADRQLEHVRRWYRLRVRTSSGLALIDLQAARDAMQPKLRLVDPDEDPTVYLSEMLRFVSSSDSSILKVADGKRLEDVDRRLVAERVTALRTNVERLHEDLRRRIGTARSRLALVERFKTRCEWHDRVHMLEVAEDAGGAGGPEDRLTAEFARYLFDQGLQPLSKPMTGGLQPDLLDPATRFYVEAKQYKSSSRGDLVKAIAQVLDTVGRLRGTQYEIDEAFCVIFRRSGPFYDLPRELRTHTVRVHLILIDIAPAAEAGSQQKLKPTVMEAGEFLDAREQDDENSDQPAQGAPDGVAGSAAHD